MGRQARAEYLARMRGRYRGADRRTKGELLGEICTVMGWHRKAAIRALGREPAARVPHRRGQTRPSGVLAALRIRWEAADRACGKRLAPFLEELVGVLERQGVLDVDGATRRRLVSWSPATIDRWLQPTRLALPRRPRTSSPALAGLAAEVAIRTWAEWTDAAPGAVQADLVAHCGVTTAGFYLTSLVLVDVATGWLDVGPVWGTGQQRVGGALDAARRRCPVPLAALHTDNGGEFLTGLVHP